MLVKRPFPSPGWMLPFRSVLGSRFLLQAISCHGLSMGPQGTNKLIVGYSSVKETEWERESCKLHRLIEVQSAWR